MRTTLNIREDALTVIKTHAEQRRISLGEAASDLVHRGAESLPQFQMKNGWVVFDLPPDAAPLSEATVREWQDRDGDEEYERAISPRR